MAEQLTGVNGNIIKWARKYYNLSQEEAASSVGVDFERYRNWENGREYPTYAKLKEISRVLHKPSAVFFFPEPPIMPDIKADLRTLSDSVVDKLSKNVILQLEKGKAYQISLKDLYSYKPCILNGRESFPKDIKDLCTYIRKIIAFPITAQKARKSDKVVFEVFREKFYELGIYVFKDAFKDNSISGLCVNDDNFPIIIINNGMSFARQTFTLFHELYHLIVGTSGAEIIRDEYLIELTNDQILTEKNCDSFANEFLVPTDDFVLELQKQELSEQRIADLSALYSVSKEAIMYKLYKMKKITPNEYNKLKESFYGDAIRKKDKQEENQKEEATTILLSYLI